MFIEKPITVSASSLLTLYQDMRLETHHRKLRAKLIHSLLGVYAINMRLNAAVKYAED